MFKYKTEAELTKMTPEERDQYSTDKREFEQKQSEKTIKEALDQFKKDLETEAKTSKEAAEQQIQSLKSDLEDQGKQISKLMEKEEEAGVNESIEKTFINALKKERDEDSELIANKQVRIALKDIPSNSVMTVNTVSAANFPSAGSSGVITSGMYGMWARFLGFFGLLSNESKIMDLIDVQPLNEARLFAINTTIIGDAEVTPECQLKPIVRMGFEDQTVDAEPIADMWLTNTKVRRFFPNLANFFKTAFGNLVNNKIPKEVLKVIRDNASAFTPNPLFNIDPNPNNYDALGAAIASLQLTGKDATGIVLSPIAYRNLKQSKFNGVYNLSNGNSISLIDGGLDWNGVKIPVIIDKDLGHDEYIVANFFEAVKGGVDNQLIYMETDGRTDSNQDSTTSLAKGVRTHVLQRFCAFMIPDGVKSLIIRDTFSNTKTLITPIEG
ncbi:hypothetical protein K5I29_02370 [Flavobacterium agricola]|uniref:Phage major capsid protein n=1 Tax=Flavobacterium agricola TaxID=2870839 RepID=A0ABY6LZP7_9FLAO|nr:hypothetical protein [Flavobacterium agricola]UYW01789.1 hypothetical protein K5I29_02370 [Flavobacterium agricola]